MLSAVIGDGLIRSIFRGEQLLDIAQQCRNLALDRAPDERVIDEVVAVYEDVAKSKRPSPDPPYGRISR